MSVLNNNALSDTQLAKLSFRPVGCLFTCLTASFDVQKLCKVMTTILQLLAFCPEQLDSFLFNKSFPVLTS